MPQQTAKTNHHTGKSLDDVSYRLTLAQLTPSGGDSVFLNILLWFAGL